MDISVLALWRDAGQYINKALDNLHELSLRHNVEFHFYENDSLDNTALWLQQWMDLHEGQVISERLGRSWGPIDSIERVEWFADYRNRLLQAVQPLESEYTLLLDSDISFKPSLIDDYSKFFNEQTVMYTSNTLVAYKCTDWSCRIRRRRRPCNHLLNPARRDIFYKYYDAFALIDSEGQPGKFDSCNPFLIEQDRTNWWKGIPIIVNSAFGGCALIKTEVLNKCRWEATGAGCEHWKFCAQARDHGNIVVVPTIYAYNVW